MIDQSIKQFALKLLLAAGDQPLTDEALKLGIRSAYRHLSFTEATLDKWLTELEVNGMISKDQHAVFGVLWTLTLAGKPVAKQVP